MHLHLVIRNKTFVVQIGREDHHKDLMTTNVLQIIPSHIHPTIQQINLMSLPGLTIGEKVLFDIKLEEKEEKNRLRHNIILSCYDNIILLGIQPTRATPPASTGLDLDAHWLVLHTRSHPTVRSHRARLETHCLTSPLTAVM